MEVQSTYKIAIIEGDYSGGEYNDEFMIRHITEWTEVTQEEYDLLKKYQYHASPNYHIIVQRDAKAVVKWAVEHYVADAEKRRIAADKRAARAREEESRRQQMAATRARRKLEKLAQEAGVMIVPKA